MSERRCWQATDLESSELHVVGTGQCAVFTHRSPDKETVNEDVVAAWSGGAGAALLVVADGMGGAAMGEQAAAAAVNALLAAVDEATQQGRALRDGVLDGFEQASEAVRALASGAATTLVAATLEAQSVRTYHVGDSGALITGQRGRLRLMTMAHSPTGYAVEAGMMDETEALGHDERHLVSNVVGDPSMTLEMSSALELAVRDTLVLASDGLFDNLTSEEIQQAVRTGSLASASERLRQACQRRMAETRAERPGKPDDLSFLIYRRGPSRPGPGGAS